MKKIRVVPAILFAAMVLLLATACKKKQTDFVEPMKAPSGQWKITRIVRDGTDLTGRFDFTAFRITFTDSAYTIANPTPFIVSKNGNWSFDDPQYPAMIMFRQQGATGSVSPVRFSYPILKGKRIMVMTFSPGCNRVSYDYTLEQL